MDEEDAFMRERREAWGVILRKDKGMLVWIVLIAFFLGVGFKNIVIGRQVSRDGSLYVNDQWFKCERWR